MKNFEILLNFPSIGRITRTTARGFGYATSQNGEQFIHISNLVGTRPTSLFGLEGRRCAFVIGGDYKAHFEGKPDWDSRVVRWVLLDESFPRVDHEAYAAARGEALRAADSGSFRRMLAADWYRDPRRRAGWGTPEVALRSESALVDAVHARLEAAENLGELIRLLATVCRSPWFHDAKVETTQVFEQFFHPSRWPGNLAVADRPLKHYDGLAFLESECGADIAGWIRAARVVAIDLESDGETIRDYGWRTSMGSARRRSDSGLAGRKLQEAVDESLQSFEQPCVVGHNLLRWDWPILERLGARFPPATERWDTLLAAWILEPWAHSHALVVEDNAHSADADAAACFALFNEQAARFAGCLPEATLELEALVDSLLDDPERFGAIGARDYPSTLHRELHGPTVFPRSQRRSFEWQRGCHVEPLTAEQRFQDPVLSAATCSAVASAGGTIFAKAIAAVVADASANGVHPCLSWLPAWLVDDELRDRLREAHAEARADNPDVTGTPIYLAEDLFQLSDEELEGRSRRGQLSVRSPDLVAALWQSARRTALRDDQVKERFPEARLGRRGRTLLAVQEDDEARWLLHAPAGLGQEAPSWYLLPNTPEWVQLELGEHRGSDIPCACVPRWRDGDAGRLDVDRIFVSPDTANRRLYLADLTHAVLNVVRASEGAAVVLVGVLCSSEARILQRNLTHLGLSSEHPGSPLRRLESLKAKGHVVVCCSIEEVPDFLQAARLLGVELEVVLDQVPLHEWHALLNDPGKGMSSLPDDREGAGIEAATVREAALRRGELRAAVEAFLGRWLEGLGLAERQPDNACLILDDRLAARHAAVASGLPRLDIPFYELSEILGDDQLELFQKYCYPRSKRDAFPEDYESYRGLLQKNWGYDDFRPLQKPAIAQIIGSTKDLLFRLPTGGGKSVVFHLPALLRSSFSGQLSIVITPLRALMRDQVEGLRRNKFIETVDYLSGGRDPWVNHEVYQGILDGRIQLLFIAPERFRVPRFREALERRRQSDGGLDLIVFDEAHCVSEWGFDFRPDYLHAARYVREEYRSEGRTGNPHRVLLTSATVTERNRRDLETELGLGGSGDYDDLPVDMPHPIQAFIEIESLQRHESREEVAGEKFEEICEILSRLNLRESAALVFARSRKDCHRISDALNDRARAEDSDLGGLRSLPFHAGLSESLKAEAADLLKGKVVNVLVCTKAFGMGMDIPHIHACIHQMPPTFIEDYLQEIGRIGRDEDARIRTGHQRVTASLLYNANDLELNTTRLREDAVGPPALTLFHDYCVSRSVSFGAAQPAICLVPAEVQLSRAVKYSESQVTSCLFWLERMGVLEVEGRLPPVFELVLMPRALLRKAEDEGQSGRLAQVLLDFAKESHAVAAPLSSAAKAQGDSKRADSAFVRLVKGLVRGVLSLLSSPPPSNGQEEVTPTHAAPTPVETKPVEEADALAISIPVRELLTRSGMSSADDLYSGLLELRKADGLQLKKAFRAHEPSSPSGDEYFKLLEHAVELVSAPTRGRVELLARSDLAGLLKDWCWQRVELDQFGENDSPEAIRAKKQEEWRIQRETYRALTTTLQLMRQCGVELKERFSDDGQAVYARSITRSMQYTLPREIAERLRRMRELHRIISGLPVDSAGERDLQRTRVANLTDITDAIEGAVRVSELRDTMKLLDSSGLFTFESDSDAHVTVVTLHRTSPMDAHDPGRPPEDRIQAGYKEMVDRFELQVLRAQAMVLLVAMPAEGRKRFIDGYFSATRADEIQRLLEDSIGAVDDEVVQGNDLLRNLLIHVRQERFTEEFDRLNEQQLQVCQAPYDQNLLVNAGPGSGKTHVLMMRCAHLIHRQRVDPSSILVLAFNRSVVHEIRERIRRLFRDLGYGSYAGRIDVTTFHAFALRYHDAADRFEEDAVSDSVHQFARSMREDPGFASVVAERYRAILIDEFQDMNEDFFAVVDALIRKCSGGGMVIGDDDQDILAWNRIAWRRRHRADCPVEAVDYFERFRTSFAPKQASLTINYRSTQEIVKRADLMVQRAAEGIGFSRVKCAGQLVADQAGSGSFELLSSREEALLRMRDAVGRGDHLAVLCRSNRECLEIYEELLRTGLTGPDKIELLGAEDFNLFKLRGPGGLLDLCRRFKDYEFVDQHIWEGLMDEFRRGGFADTERSVEEFHALYSLVKDEVGRPTVRDIRDFILEMRESDVERLKARNGTTECGARITVATVHKVKGLEYDTVVVVPSAESFPFTDGHHVTIEEAAAEEARLYYVAMTRARTHFHGGWGARERAWWIKQERRTDSRASGYRLKGSPQEIWVSLPGLKEQVDRGLQGYIESQVGTGDVLRFRGKQFLHGATPVGALSSPAASKRGSSPSRGEGRVANVIRYTCGPYFRERNLEWWQKLHPSVQQRGWFYVVLVEEA